MILSCHQFPGLAVPDHQFPPLPLSGMGQNHRAIGGMSLGHPEKYAAVVGSQILVPFFKGMNDKQSQIEDAHLTTR